MRRQSATRRTPRRRATPTMPWRRWAADAVALAILLGILAALLLAAAAAPQTRLAFTVDRAPADVALRYFYPVERNSERAYRWAEPRATIVLPLSRPGTYRITLGLLDGAPAPARSATIAAGERTLTVAPLTSAARDVTVEATITPQEWRDNLGHDLALTLAAPPARVGNDPRPLGVVLTRLAIAPQQVPAPWQPALLLPNLLLLLLAYAVLRGCGVPLRLAVGAVGLTLAAYALFVALARLDALALAYTLALNPLRPLLALALLGGALLAARRPFRRRGTPRARLLWGLGIVAAYAGATVALTWPLALHLHTATATGADPPLQLWIARWIEHALVTDPFHLYDANVFYPYPTTLAYSDANIPMALLHWPLALLLGDDLVAFNLLMLGTFVLAATGMYALTARLTRNRGAAFLAGLAFAFLPVRFAHLSHLQQLSHAWTPWVVLALLLLLARQQWRWSVILGVALAVQALSSFYLAAQILCVVGVVALVALIADRRARSWRTLSRLALAALISLALVLPLAAPYLTLNAQQGLERRIEESAQAGRSATLDAYRRVLDPTPLWPGLLPPVEESYEDILYPGAVVLLGALGALAAWRRRRYAVTFLLVGGVAFVLSLGPTLLLPGGRTVPLPYTALYDLFPLFKALRVPARFGLLTDFALVVLAAGGAAAGWRWLARRLPPARRPLAAFLATTLLAVAIVGETLTLPIPLDALDRSPATTVPYRWLGTQPDDGAVLDLPIYYARFSRATLMYRSTYHWHPLVEGYSGFLPPDYWARLSPLTRDLARPNGTTSRAVGLIDETTIGLVRDLGVRYIVFHRSDYKAEDWPLVLAALERTGAVERAHDSDDAVIYRLK